MEDTQLKSKTALLSIFSNSVLVVGKLVVGGLVGSVSIISEAIHSGMDLLAAIIALVAVKTSDIPPDEEHPYGHGRAENVSSGVEALLILVAGVWIIFESVKKMVHPEPIQHVWLGAAVMLVASLINLFVALRLFKVGNQTKSSALLGDAWHLMTDVWTSAGVMSGLLLIWVGGIFFPEVNLQVVDPLVGILVAVLIISTGFRLVRESVNALLDKRLPDDEEKLIHDHVLELKPVARGFHKLRTRSVGNLRFIEFHLKVDGRMSVREAHTLSHKIQSSIEEHLKGSSVTIHFEPCITCTEQCLKNCVLTPEEREQVLQRTRKRINLN